MSYIQYKLLIESCHIFNIKLLIESCHIFNIKLLIESCHMLSAFLMSLCRWLYIEDAIPEIHEKKGK